MKDKIFKIFVFGIFIWLIIKAGSGPKDVQTPINNTQDITSNTSVEKYSYSISKMDDLSRKAMTKLLSAYTTSEIRDLPTNRKLLYHVVVRIDEKGQQIIPMVNSILNDIASKDIEADEIIMNYYSDESLVGHGYDIGSAVWAPNGELGNITPDIATSNVRIGYELKTNIKNDLYSYLSQRSKSEDKFGFTELQRREIYKELVNSEDRANYEAEKKYPMTAKGAKLQSNLISSSKLTKELRDKYKLQLLKKYKLSDEDLRQLTHEAREEGWSLD